MIEQLGNYSLMATFLAALLGVLGGLAAWRDRGLLKWTRIAVIATAPLLTIASIALLAALLTSDTRFAYVASHSERAMPIQFKIAAFWAGQEGSILLWAWMVTVMGVIATLSRRKLDAPGEPITLATLSVVNAFFAALLLFAANPFELVPGGAAVEGRGLNPLLQHWAMVLHPPTLFLGYAGFTIPFAIMLGALVAGKAANGWAGEMRRWVLFSWVSLGCGIALGAWWAYVELGWGGYWAWDPVENASLLPWLTGTALMHTIIVQQQRGTYRVWGASLTALTFLLCIFGTYITRSGVIQSVHAFGESVVGTFFLGLILVGSVVSVAAITWRWGELRSKIKIESIVSREAMFLAANVLLLVMTGATLVGTIFPLISGVFVSEAISVSQGYYNRVVAPIGLVMVAVMAIGPLLVYGKDAAQSLRKGVAAPAAVTAVILVLAIVLGIRSFAALVALAIAVMTLLVIGFAFVPAVRGHMRLRGGNFLMASLRVIDLNHRRYGGQLAHAGVALMIIGIAGSNLFAEERSITMTPGQTVDVGRYTLRYDSLRDVRELNYVAVQATLQLTTDSGRTVQLMPERRFYDKAENPSAEVAIRSSLREDVYVALVGWEGGGKSIAIQAMVNPLTMWLWIGATMTVGAGVFCMLPRLLPRTALAPSPVARMETAAVRPPRGSDAVTAH
ncbi:MAG: heme lyase CcmF/NrfE family subunit [Phycisphaerales bacterium JB039]